MSFFMKMFTNVGDLLKYLKPIANIPSKPSTMAHKALEASCMPDLIPQTPTICMFNQRSRQCYDKGRKKKKAQQRLCKRDVISGRGVHTHIAIVKIDRPEGKTASSHHLNITIFYTACFPSSSVCRQASAGTAIGSVGAFQSLVPQLC